MKFLHLTHLKNLQSILKHGLAPSYINMDSHWESFEKAGLKERKCVYMWDAETYNNGKYLMDMIYTKMYIHPRNKIFDIRYKQILKDHYDDWDDNELYINFKEFGNKLYGENGKYTVLEIESSRVNPIGFWDHVQTPGGDDFGTTVVMDDRYAHEDKKLYISESMISANNIKVVENIDVRVYDDRKLGFSFKRV